jgi:hypothetical protein
LCRARSTREKHSAGRSTFREKTAGQGDAAVGAKVDIEDPKVETTDKLVGFLGGLDLLYHVPSPPYRSCDCASDGRQVVDD